MRYVVFVLKILTGLLHMVFDHCSERLYGQDNLTHGSIWLNSTIHVRVGEQTESIKFHMELILCGWVNCCGITSFLPPQGHLRSSF